MQLGRQTRKNEKPLKLTVNSQFSQAQSLSQLHSLSHSNYLQLPSIIDIILVCHLPTQPTSEYLNKYLPSLYLHVYHKCNNCFVVQMVTPVFPIQLLVSFSHFIIVLIFLRSNLNPDCIFNFIHVTFIIKVVTCVTSCNKLRGISSQVLINS